MGKKLTLEEFIVHARAVHGDRYSYDKFIYVNDNTPGIIICPKHGDFSQRPYNHKNGNSCPKCLGRSLNNEEWIEHMITNRKKLGKPIYDYSLVKRLKNTEPIKIICPDHGIFEQSAASHYNGANCSRCTKNWRKTIDEHIEDFIKIHGDLYDYSLAKKSGCKNSKTKIEIICPKHGIFIQGINDHKNGAGCSVCSGTKKITYSEFLNRIDKKIKEYSGEDVSPFTNYTYLEKNFLGYTNNMEIICKNHGPFIQTPSQHLSCSIGCLKCSIEHLRKTSTKRFTWEHTKRQFFEIHQDKYIYPDNNYINTQTKIKAICPVHGPFLIKPMNLKQGVGCSKCQINKAENALLELFMERNIQTEYRNTDFIKKEIDVLIYKYKFGIEYNGLNFHSFGISSWGAMNNYKRLDKNKHLNKTIELETRGYQLFHIREDQWKNLAKQDIWKSILLNKCEISHKIHARKLQVVDLSQNNKFVSDFLEDNHLQGSSPSKVKLGLQDPKTGIVYSIMTFGQSRFNKNFQWELLRFCNLKFHNVRGAASKLLKAFERWQQPVSLISYANRDWSQGNLYRQLGFDFSHASEPNYFYISKNLEIISRQRVQKHKLQSWLESRDLVFDSNLSERDNMINNGYRIYYDTGNLVYHKNYK